jgi:NAD(P)-dependent dehydrogenase (short-subunit alcohol dehydrogenase family)
MAVALVTAASQGIGAAIARGLAARGWQLALMSRSDRIDAIATELGAVAVRGSVTNAADLERLVQAAIDRWGRIDAVVNNTGHPAKGDPLALTDAQWEDGYQLLFGCPVSLPPSPTSRVPCPVSSGRPSYRGRASWASAWR